jgi:hypothetical protein
MWQIVEMYVRDGTVRVHMNIIMVISLTRVTTAVIQMVNPPHGVTPSTQTNAGAHAPYLRANTRNSSFLQTFLLYFYF